MVQVLYKDKVIADSQDTVYLEGNHYFPEKSLKLDIVQLSASKTIYTCPWKGGAEYKNAQIAGEEAKDIAWVYPNPKPAAAQIAGLLAFDKRQVAIISK